MVANVNVNFLVLILKCSYWYKTFTLGSIVNMKQLALLETIYCNTFSSMLRSYDLCIYPSFSFYFNMFTNICFIIGILSYAIFVIGIFTCYLQQYFQATITFTIIMFQVYTGLSCPLSQTHPQYWYWYCITSKVATAYPIALRLISALQTSPRATTTMITVSTPLNSPWVWGL